jgi:hypothetical protein
MIFPYPLLTKLLIMASLAALVLAGCQPAPLVLPATPALAAAPSDTVAPTPTARPSGTPTLPPTTTPHPSTATLTPPSAAQRSRYNLVVVYDPRLYQAQVQEKITYINSGSSPLNELELVVDANRRSGQFALKSLALAGAQKNPVFKLDGMRLTLPLETPLQPGQTAALELQYDLHLPDQALPLGYTSHQANFVDWYPYLPPYTPATGWVVQPAAHVGEHLSYDLADFEVDIQLPEKSGQQVIAASAPAESAGNGIQRFKLAGARSFAWSISPIYRRVTAQAAAASGRMVNVSGYVFPEHVEAGQAAAVYVAEALSLFSTLFTPYQHSEFSFVEVDFADGMESDGMFFLNKAYFAYTNGAQSGLCALSVHESAHQWWYGQVGNNQALAPWLDESLATYSELLYYQKLRPELVDWWWTYRVAPYKPIGNVGSTIYDFQSYRPYVNTVYLRGVQFLDELHKQMGDEVFLAFLRNYASLYGGKQASPQDFFTLLRQSTSVNVQSLVDTFFTK